MIAKFEFKVTVYYQCLWAERTQLLPLKYSQVSKKKKTYFWTMFQKTKIETRLIVNSGLVRSI